MTETNELVPTKENLEDLYVLQLIEGLSRQQDEIEDLTAEVGRLQLIVGRYQFMWQAAQLCINKIDDWFEYAVFQCSSKDAQDHVRKHLAIYTKAISRSKEQIGK